MILNTVITEVRRLLQDINSPQRYSDVVLLGFANQALKRIAVLRPDLFAYIGPISTTAGSVIQSMPSDSLRVMEMFSVQDGNAIVEPIIFEDGMLRVPKNNPVLQHFLHYHPMNGSVFVEVNYEKDAQKEVEFLNVEVDALIEARSLSIEQLENVARVLFGKDPSVISTTELKRDILIYAKRDPKGFLNLINDPMLKLESNVHKYFDSKVLAFRNGNKEVWFNIPSNKRKMMNVPFGSDPYTEVALFLQTEEGIDAIKLLEKSMEVQY